MQLNTIINTALSTILKDGVIPDFLADKAGNKAISIFQQHFTFTTFEIANSYQNSYNYALAAIGAGLAKPEQRFSFLQKLTHSKIKREFADQIELLYFQPFATKIPDKTALRNQLIDKIKFLSKLPPIFSADKRNLTESELASFITYKGGLAITDLILEQLHALPDYIPNETVEAFFRFNDLLAS